jgi:hypothetical protein
MCIHLCDMHNIWYVWRDVSDRKCLSIWSWWAVIFVQCLHNVLSWKVNMCEWIVSLRGHVIDVPESNVLADTCLDMVYTEVIFPGMQCIDIICLTKRIWREAQEITCLTGASRFSCLWRYVKNISCASRFSCLWRYVKNISWSYSIVKNITSTSRQTYMSSTLQRNVTSITSTHVQHVTSCTSFPKPHIRNIMYVSLRYL